MLYIFYSFPHGVETALQKEKNVICLLAEKGKYYVNNLRDNNDATLNATEKNSNQNRTENIKNVEISRK